MLPEWGKQGRRRGGSEARSLHKFMGDEAGLRSSQEHELASQGQDPGYGIQSQTQPGGLQASPQWRGRSAVRPGRQAAGLNLGLHQQGLWPGRGTAAKQLELYLQPQLKASPAGAGSGRPWPWPWPPHSAAWEPLPRPARGRGAAWLWGRWLGLSPRQEWGRSQGPDSHTRCNALYFNIL